MYPKCKFIPATVLIFLPWTKRKIWKILMRKNKCICNWGYILKLCRIQSSGWKEEKNSFFLAVFSQSYCFLLPHENNSDKIVYEMLLFLPVRCVSFKASSALLQEYVNASSLKAANPDCNVMYSVYRKTLCNVLLARASLYISQLQCETRTTAWHMPTKSSY